MAERPSHPLKAYNNPNFLNSADARPLRILSEYLEPRERFDGLDVSDTIVVMGSARTPSREDAEAALAAARRDGGDLAGAEMAVKMSRYYEDAREFARRITLWSKGLEDPKRRFVVCTGGGGGIMEAANRGASEARGINVGLGISLPFETHDNPFITRELSFEFHYFFMRKFWFIYLAKAIVLFPGGFGTLDELFEILTLVQTRRLRKPRTIILYGNSYWDQVVDFQTMVDHGTVSTDDMDLFHRSDSVDETIEFITRELAEKALDQPGGNL